MGTLRFAPLTLCTPSLQNRDLDSADFATTMNMGAVVPRDDMCSCDHGGLEWVMIGNLTLVLD